MDSYKRWADVPANLKTKTQLKEMGMRPARGQEPVAIFDSSYGDWKLYELSQAVPRVKADPEQAARLEAARQKLWRLRACLYFERCHEVLSLSEYGAWKRGRIYAAKRKRGEDLSKAGHQFICRFCQDRLRAAEWARKVLADERAVILDTETTGIEDAEIVEIAIINTQGQALFNTLVKPHGAMGATHIHGITEEDVVNAPTWLQIDSEVVSLLFAASRVITYGANFDSGVVVNSRKRWGLPDLVEVEPLEKIEVDMEGSAFNPYVNWECAMEMYAQWYGDWSSYFKDYKWQRLNGGHRALGDAMACLEHIKRMAKGEDNE
jgi:DNA polymerase-3 subunit epsilon